MIEPSFDPRALTVSLNYKKKVHIDIVQAGHGFADPFSKRYQEGIVKEVIVKFFSISRKTGSNFVAKG